jgi:hypothetical protein
VPAEQTANTNISQEQQQSSVATLNVLNSCNENIIISNNNLN